MVLGWRVLKDVVNSVDCALARPSRVVIEAGAFNILSAGDVQFAELRLSEWTN